LSNRHCAFCVVKFRGGQRTIFVPWGAELGRCSLRSSRVPCFNRGRGCYVWRSRRGISLGYARLSRVYYQTFRTSASDENSKTLSQLVGRNNVPGAGAWIRPGPLSGSFPPGTFNIAKFCVAPISSRELEETGVLTYLLLDMVIYPSHSSKGEKFPPFRVPRLVGRSGVTGRCPQNFRPQGIVCGRHGRQYRTFAHGAVLVHTRRIRRYPHCQRYR